MGPYFPDEGLRQPGEGRCGLEGQETLGHESVLQSREGDAASASPPVAT
jgi:hypothetical protein